MPFAVPYGSYQPPYILKEPAEVFESLYPQYKQFNESETALNENCDEQVSCTFFPTLDWQEGSTITQSFPCEYLIFDICEGYHACECDNGYWMHTEGMFIPDEIDF